MEAWKRVWRQGFEPQLSTESLQALGRGLASDDARLLQGATTEPPPLACCANWPCQAGCLVAFCGMADGLATVAEVEEYFARLCFEADARVGEPSACRYLLNWFDGTPRDEMRALLLAEVERSLALRQES